ncbi:glycosyltransferase family 4 protein [Carnobacterium maltaromaticum]|uniref:glycosyltransferase family 4 protein n=1 Tax=Carnobacterium maltaromaticum TaxID=2751 RepID=UPI00191B9615|nr:glycosyltransferase family 4 protein [Carnobacterium maltaromaticum]CAD5899709.1 Glycosytransferase [Carnobacterium maltaromaticum]
MKVAIVGPDASAKGGIATVIRNFIGITAHSSMNLIFFTTWKEGTTRKHMIDTLSSIILFPFFLKKNNIELIHFHVAQNGSFYRKALLLMWAKLLGIPSIFHLHASQFDEFYASKPKKTKQMIRFVLEQATGVVALSESWKDFYESIADIECEVIENAVLVPEKNSYNADAKKIMSFGRLGQRKGTFDLLEVAKEIKNIYPDYQFILYGDGNIQQVEETIAKLGLSNVQLGGWITDDEKENIFKTCKIHVLPSFQEGMPMAILETMAHGIPNISTTVGGIPKVIDSGMNGLLIEPGNQEQLKKALVDLIENEYLMRKFSQASYQKIQKNFSLDAYYQKWIQYYEKIEGE